MNNRAKVEFLSSDAGETFPEVVAGLSAKDAQGSGSGAVASFFAIFKDVCEEIEVSLHEVIKAEISKRGTSKKLI